MYTRISTAFQNVSLFYTFSRSRLICCYVILKYIFTPHALKQCSPTAACVEPVFSYRNLFSGILHLNKKNIFEKKCWFGWITLQ